MKIGKKFNRQYMQIALYVIFTCIIIYSLSLLAKNAPVIYRIVLDKLGQILTVLKPIVIGFALAYVLDGVVTFIEVNIKKVKGIRRLKSTRGLAVFATLILVMLFLSLLVSLVVYSVTDQIRLANFDDFIMIINGYTKSASDFIKTLSDKLNSLNLESTEINNWISTISQYLLDVSGNLVSGAVGSLSNITGFVGTLFFSIIIMIYFLIDGKMIKEVLAKVNYALFSDKANERMRGFVHDANVVFSGYLKGQLLDVLVMMVLISITLSIVGVKFAIIIGIIAGLGNLIPYCGPFIAYGASAIVCLINGEPMKMVAAIIALIIIQAVDGNIIGPKLLSQSIKVHPLLVIISLIIGSAVGGFFGMLFAVPVGALIKVIFMRYIDSRIAYKEAVKKLREDQ